MFGLAILSLDVEEELKDFSLRAWILFSSVFWKYLMISWPPFESQWQLLPSQYAKHLSLIAWPFQSSCGAVTSQLAGSFCCTHMETGSATNNASGDGH